MSMHCSLTSIQNLKFNQIIAIVPAGKRSSSNTTTIPRLFPRTTQTSALLSRRNMDSSVSRPSLFPEHSTLRNRFSSSSHSSSLPNSSSSSSVVDSPSPPSSATSPLASKKKSSQKKPDSLLQVQKDMIEQTIKRILEPHIARASSAWAQRKQAQAASSFSNDNSSDSNQTYQSFDAIADLDYSESNEKIYPPADGKDLLGTWERALRAILPLGGFSEGNAIRIFHDGDSSFEAQWKAIEGAKERVWCETYILGPAPVDKVAYGTLKRLADAARRGVDVVLIYDDFGSSSFGPLAGGRVDMDEKTRRMREKQNSRDFGQDSKDDQDSDSDGDFDSKDAKNSSASSLFSSVAESVWSFLTPLKRYRLAQRDRAMLRPMSPAEVVEELERTGAPKTVEEVTELAHCLEELSQAGVRVVRFNPLWTWPWGRARSYFFRNHRKLLVVDDEVGFCGGMNVAAEYAGPRCNGLSEFRDTHVEVRGKAVEDMANVFMDSLDEASLQGTPMADRSLAQYLRMWKRRWTRNRSDSSPKKTPLIPPSSELQSKPNQSEKDGSDATQPSNNDTFPSLPLFQPSESGVFVQVLRSNVYRRHRHIQRAVRVAVASAVHTCYMTTPYFLPSRRLRDAIAAAARRGVDVRLLLSGEGCDVACMRYASSHLYGILLRSGVRIYEYGSASALSSSTSPILRAGSIGSSSSRFQNIGQQEPQDNVAKSHSSHSDNAAPDSDHSSSTATPSTAQPPIPRRLHAKVMLVDGIFSTVGSFNLDRMSDWRNLEVNVNLLDPESATNLQRQFLIDLEHSREVDLKAVEGRSWFRRTIDFAAFHIARFIS